MSPKSLIPSENPTREMFFEMLGEISKLESVYEHLLVRIEQIAERGERDELSGLLRRNAFFARWKTMIRRCIESGMESGVILVDVDHFKRINDTEGHQRGDEVIRRLGTLLREFEASGVICGRYGGEEFVLAYAGAEVRGTRIAESIRERVSEIGITVSQGFCPEVRANEEESCLRAADEALYEAKRSGRNRTCTARRPRSE